MNIRVNKRVKSLVEVEIPHDNGDVTVGYETNFDVTLESIKEKEHNLKNSKETAFRIATASFIDAEDKPAVADFMVWQGNLDKGMEVGKKYVATIRFTPEREEPSLSISHFEPIFRPTGAMFGFTGLTETADVNETLEDINTNSEEKATASITADEFDLIDEDTI